MTWRARERRDRPTGRVEREGESPAGGGHDAKIAPLRSRVNVEATQNHIHYTRPWLRVRMFTVLNNKIGKEAAIECRSTSETGHADRLMRDRFQRLCHDLVEG